MATDSDQVTPSPAALPVNEAKSFLLLILGVAAIAGGTTIALLRHRPQPQPLPVPAEAPRPHMPGKGITRSRDSIVVRSGWAVARIGRYADQRVFVQRFGDWEERRIATTVARALAEPDFAAALGLSADQLAKLRACNLTLSRPYAGLQARAIIDAHRAWERSGQQAGSAEEKALIAAVESAGETLEAKPEFSAQVAAVKLIVAPDQWEYLRFPSGIPARPATAPTSSTAPR